MSFIGSLFPLPTSVMSFMCGDGGGGHICSRTYGPVTMRPEHRQLLLFACRIQKEYKANGSLRRLSRNSYEALPSNYGLGRNMLAGAFAGIAV